MFPFDDVIMGRNKTGLSIRWVQHSIARAVACYCQTLEYVIIFIIFVIPSLTPSNHNHNHRHPYSNERPPPATQSYNVSPSKCKRQSGLLLWIEPIQCLWYTSLCDTMVTMEQQMLPGKYLKIHCRKARCAVWLSCVTSLTRHGQHSNRHDMMTSLNGIIFRVTGHLCGEFTGPRWIPRTKASDAELWCFLWSAPE